MIFELHPILSSMKAFYSKPISRERFQDYLKQLQGNTKGDLSLPISGFNPMAKEHVLQKINELEELEAETILETIIEQFNQALDTADETKIMVVLNLADDAKGGWTNRYTTDFDSKFKLNALIERQFCTPYFWTSENYSRALIEERTLAYLSRTLFWLTNSKPKTLEDFLKQEIFVQTKLKKPNNFYENKSFDKLKKFYLEHKPSEDYSLIFNFFYGDHISQTLNYPEFGIEETTGFDYAQFLAKANNQQ